MYCLSIYCFTRTTLFITTFTLVKCMCIPSFTSIGCCISELHAHLCPDHNVQPETVYTRTTMIGLHVDIPIIMYSPRLFIVALQELQ